MVEASRAAAGDSYFSSARAARSQRQAEGPAKQTEEEREETAVVSSWLTSSGLLGTLDEDTDITSSGSSSRQKQKGKTKSSSSSSSGNNIKPSTVQRALWSFSSPEVLLKQLELTFPAWASNGCRLVGMTAGTAHASSGSSSSSNSSSSSGEGDVAGGCVVVAAPSPAEAAVALKGVGIAARKAKLRQAQMMGLVSNGTNIESSSAALVGLDTAGLACVAIAVEMTRTCPSLDRDMPKCRRV
jgi:hypothetical protein